MKEFGYPLRGDIEKIGGNIGVEHITKCWILWKKREICKKFVFPLTYYDTGGIMYELLVSLYIRARGYISGMNQRFSMFLRH